MSLLTLQQADHDRVAAIAGLAGVVVTPQASTAH